MGNGPRSRADHHRSSPKAITDYDFQQRIEQAMEGEILALWFPQPLLACILPPSVSVAPA
jgi:hypothetical protein